MSILIDYYLDGSENMQPQYLAEAKSYRTLDWGNRAGRGG